MNKGRYPIIVIALVWFGISIWQASQLTGLTESEAFIDPENPAARALTILQREFYP